MDKTSHIQWWTPQSNRQVTIRPCRARLIILLISPYLPTRPATRLSVTISWKNESQFLVQFRVCDTSHIWVSRHPQDERNSLSVRYADVAWSSSKLTKFRWQSVDFSIVCNIFKRVKCWHSQKNASRNGLQFWHLDASWPSLELNKFWSQSVDFSHFNGVSFVRLHAFWLVLVG